jgi:hypothetical protein
MDEPPVEVHVLPPEPGQLAALSTVAVGTGLVPPSPTAASAG